MTRPPFDPGILAALLNLPDPPTNWKQAYFASVVERCDRRIATLRDRIDGITTGRTMPDATNVAIGSGKRFEIAVMFVDITGFTDWPSGTYQEQEAILCVMDVFMAEMMNIIRDHAGVFEKNTGDGIMAYFGTETSQARDTVRQAVEAAVLMHYVNDQYISPWLTRNGLWSVPFRIGIDYGGVTIAKIGIHGTNQFVAVGATANVANRLLRATSTGVALGDRVYKHLPRNWDRHCTALPATTGFVYRWSGAPYPVWDLTYRMHGHPYS